MAMIYVILLMMLIGGIYLYDKNQRYKAFQLTMLAALVKEGADIDAQSKAIVFDSKRYNRKPIDIESAISIVALDDNLTRRFIDCDITDEAIAWFKETRSMMGAIEFKNCRVVKHQSLTPLIPLHNELNEPLPAFLAKGQPWPGTTP